MLETVKIGNLQISIRYIKVHTPNSNIKHVAQHGSFEWSSTCYTIQYTYNST